MSVREGLLNQVKIELGGGLNTAPAQVSPRQKETQVKRSCSRNKIGKFEKKAERPARLSKEGRKRVRREGADLHLT